MVPWLSVVMPTFQGARWVAEALESIRAQGGDGYEVVAVDDGSTDATVDLLRSFAKSLPLRVLQPPRSGNWIAGTNLGLREARADYACILHQDDAWLPGRLQEIRAEIAHRPALVVHPSIFVDDAGRQVGTWRCPLPAVRGAVASGTFLSRLLVQNFVAVPAATFDRALALEAGGLDEKLWFTGDWDLWLRLGARGPVRYVPRPLAAFRVHAASQTVARDTDSDERRSQLLTVLHRHLEALPPDEGRDGVLRAALHSVEVNVALATAARGRTPALLPLLWSFARLGPRLQARYLRDSRIVERALARLRLRRGKLT